MQTSVIGGGEFAYIVNHKCSRFQVPPKTQIDKVLRRNPAREAWMNLAEHIQVRVQF